ncbi:hypothetical protein BD410DRAFT_839734 [Rickenella mellea]|uniref:Uncharacterized protein n=1 Tax=Rickenella mellea TaxID=50990 RepID=A0A4Y7Q5T4_9AGAM|nr:hypothetical protein BD410DRAFT_839734 [Rickenella mellea]
MAAGYQGVIERLALRYHPLPVIAIVLFTVLSKSAKSATFIQQGAAFLSHFKKTIPAFLANHSLIYNNFSLAVWKRMFNDITPSFEVKLPKVGSVTLAEVAILCSTILKAANGSSLVSTLAWHNRVYFFI